MKWKLVCLSLSMLVMACQSPENLGPEVRVTLDDGQILFGRLRTKEFTLKTGLGDLPFAAADAGEIGPVEGKNVKQAGREIRLWLRNGSEFVGRWQKPSVAVDLNLGGQAHPINVPVEKLKRLQFRGQPVWSNNAVFRVQTRRGDDFFVDVNKTQLPFVTEFGEIKPFLHEVHKLEPLDRKNRKWRIHLTNGTLVKAEFKQQSLALTLAMGPKNIKLPLAQIKKMDRQYLQYRQAVQSSNSLSSKKAGLLDLQDKPGDVREEASRRAVYGQQQGASSGGSRGYYSNRAQKRAKDHAAQSWSKLKN